jgi:hypothetical protein
MQKVKGVHAKLPHLIKYFDSESLPIEVRYEISKYNDIADFINDNTKMVIIMQFFDGNQLLQKIIELKIKARRKNICDSGKPFYCNNGCNSYVMIVFTMIIFVGHVQKDVADSVCFPK